jgi:D-glycero-D-manno-heptose 1,7-bisphosphate phosphatase
MGKFQAVILAGGKGTRLYPITKDTPKPMIEFHGKPFISYLLQMLKDNGVEKVLLLLGHLPEKIMDYCGDGSRWGLKIDYSIGGVDDDTGTRIVNATQKIDDTFLLMYCDNYWPMDLARMKNHFEANECDAMVTVYMNKDKYTKDNILIGDDGFIRVYDKGRKTPGLKGVDIGFLIMKKRCIDLLPEGNTHFEREIYPSLSEAHKFLAYPTEHRYYSVSSHERLSLTNEFLSFKKTIILDRDGVINKKGEKARYVCGWEDWKWIPGAVEAIKLLKSNGYIVIIVSNQAGIARGAMTENDLKSIHENMLSELRKKGGDIDRIYYCPHGWDDGCECRKPKPGMLFQAQRDFHIDLTRTFFIGDDERDVQAGQAAGCRTLLVNGDNSLLKLVSGIVLKS